MTSGGKSLLFQNLHRLICLHTSALYVCGHEMLHDQSFHFTIGHTALIHPEKVTASRTAEFVCAEARRGAVISPGSCRAGRCGTPPHSWAWGCGTLWWALWQVSSEKKGIKRVREKTDKGNGDGKEGGKGDRNERGSYWRLVKRLAGAHIDGSCREKKTKAYKRWIYRWIPPNL